MLLKSVTVYNCDQGSRGQCQLHPYQDQKDTRPVPAACLAGVLKLLRAFDHTLPYAITDNLWFHSKHPSPHAPRCLPCHVNHSTIPQVGSGVAAVCVHGTASDMASVNYQYGSLAGSCLLDQTVNPACAGKHCGTAPCWLQPVC